MAETHWHDLAGQELRYDDHTWELTGDVTVRSRGELVVVEAKQLDGTKRGRASLHFDAQSSGESLNPGNLGDLDQYIERDENGHTLVVATDGRRYRYVLNRIKYD